MCLKTVVVEKKKVFSEEVFLVLRKLISDSAWFLLVRRAFRLAASATNEQSARAENGQRNMMQSRLRAAASANILRVYYKCKPSAAALPLVTNHFPLALPD